MRCLYDGDHPCGKCPACLANRQRAFMFRLDHEKEAASFYFWLTLQYSDEHVPRLESGEMCFSKQHCRELFERLRKKYSSGGIKFKHFLVSEYGPNATHRPHYHCLLFVYTVEQDVSKLYKLRHDLRDFLIHEAWPYGHVTEKSYHGRVLAYLTKYCLKPEMLGQFHTMKPFTLISKGIGLSFLDKLTKGRIDQMKNKLDFTYLYAGSKIQLPRYYVDKILPHSLDDIRRSSDPLERQKIWEIRHQLRVQQGIIHDQKQSKINQDPRYYENQRENREQSFANFRAAVKMRKDL